MNITKKNTHRLEKCYSIAPLQYNGQPHLLVAAEKTDPCLLFDLNGRLEETVWDSPGGTMSMVQIPGSNGEFLATHKFYSPNDSKEAKIVYVSPKGKNDWEVKTLVELPFAHRFDIITKGGVNYLFACALKSGHEFKEDWSSPGQVWVGELPEDLSEYHDDNQLVMKPIMDGLLKNHGYCKVNAPDGPWAAVAADNGIFRFTPPAEQGGTWEIEQLTGDAASDMAFADMDGDGELEMLVITPFHGDTIKIYKLQNGKYEDSFTFDEKLEFAHGIWGGKIYGKDMVILGHRKGARNLYACTYDAEKAAYVLEKLDSDVGPANVLCYQKDDKACIVSTNREIDEIAFYEIESC